MVMETGRRDFLKLLGLAGAAATMPKLVLAQLEEAEVVTPIEETPPFATLQFITPKKTYQLGILKQFDFPQATQTWHRFNGLPMRGRMELQPIKLGVYIEHGHVVEANNYIRSITNYDRIFTRDEYLGDVVGHMKLYDGKILSLKIKETFIQEINAFFQRRSTCRNYIYSIAGS